MRYLLVIALLLAGCQSTSVFRLSENVEGNTFRVRAVTRGDAATEHTLRYQGPDWELSMGAAAELTSPAHQALAESAKDALAILPTLVPPAAAATPAITATSFVKDAIARVLRGQIENWLDLQKGGQ